MPRNKFGNTPTIVDGIRFASKAEARRWQELQLLEKAHQITLLRRQPRFKIHGNDGRLICTYVGDFAYNEFPDLGHNTGQQAVVEDVKGVETATFKLKAKLFRAAYPGVVLRLVKA